MTEKELYEKMSAPFASSDVEWRVSNTSKDKSRGLAVPYIDSRAIQYRLDAVVGPFSWRSSYQAWHQSDKKASQLCTLSIYMKERGEWVDKCDGAENTDIEPIKGGISDSFKRAAVMWGIGRYLYSLEGVWVSLKDGKYIVDSEYARLDSTYEKMVFTLTGQAPPKATAHQRASMPPDAAAPDGQPAAAPKAAKTSPPPLQFDYAVKKAQPQRFKSGSGFVLSLVPAQKGPEVVAYLQGEHPDIADGICLRNVKLAKVPGAAEGKTINIMQGYEIAA